MDVKQVIVVRADLRVKKLGKLLAQAEQARPQLGKP